VVPERGGCLAERWRGLVRRAVGTVLLTVLAAGLALLLPVVFPDAPAAGSAVVLILMLALAIGLISRWSERDPRDDRPREPSELQALAEQLRARTLKAARDEAAALVRLDRVMELGVEPHLRVVHDPLGSVASAKEPATVREAFEQSGGRLLLVGEPGSGKSIAAYQLAYLLAEQTVAPYPVPVLVNLSAWDDQEQFGQYVADALLSQSSWYDRVTSDRGLVEQWVATHRYTLILDGLDEVADGLRSECMQRLEDWLPEHMPVVVTCRTYEFAQLLEARELPHIRLFAVGLRPFTEAQITQVVGRLAGRDPQWSEFSRPYASGQRWAVRQALARPLILNLALASQIGVAQLREAGRNGPERVEQVVIDGYLEAQVRGDVDLRRWMVWIAAYLRGGEPPGTPVHAPKPTDSTVFELARLTPEFVPLRVALPALGLVIGLLWGLTFVLLHGLGFRLILGLVPNLVSGLLLGLLVGFEFGLSKRYRSAVPQRIELRWPAWGHESWRLESWMALRLKVALVVVLVFAFLLVVAFGRADEWAIFGLSWGLFVGVYLVLVTGLIWLWSGLTLRRPGLQGGGLDGPWRRSRVALRLGFVFGLALGGFGLVLAGLVVQLALGGRLWGIVLYSGLVFGLALGTAAAMARGGWFLVLQWSLKRQLRKRADLCGEPLAVLVKGVDLGVLRPVGSGVRFVHERVGKALIERPPGDCLDLVRVYDEQQTRDAASVPTGDKV
jgi:hypothetical protein